MDPNVAFAVYVLAAVVFAIPAIATAVFAWAAVNVLIFAVRAVVAHFSKPETVEVVTPVKTVEVPSGLTFEEFDAWLDTAFDEPAADPKAPVEGDFWDPRNTEIYAAPAR